MPRLIIAGREVVGNFGRGNGRKSFGFSGQRSGKRTLERDGENFVHGVDEVELHGVLDVVGQLGEVFLVGAGQDGFEDSGAQSGEEFFLEAADGAAPCRGA